MAKGKSAKSSLANALASQQSRLKKKSQAEHAAQQRAKQEAAKGKGGTTHASNGKGKAKAAPARTTIPYAPTDRILLIGEGNFSFAHALVCDPPKALCSAAGSPSSPGAGPSTLAVLPAANVTATAYDSEADCYSKYPSAPALVAALRARGATVLFGVDAARLDNCAPLRGQTFDRVVWNFPHAGAGIADQDRNVRANQRLVLAFLASAPAVLAQGALPEVHVPKRKKADENDEDENPAMDVLPEVEDQDAPPPTRGTVLITLRNVPPYTLWYARTCWQYQRSWR
jgi:25S rRNA (uracil2634-N3)-methyltransferase